MVTNKMIWVYLAARHHRFMAILSFFPIPGAVCVSVCSPKWVYAIESLCCNIGALSSSTHLCCNYSLWMKSFFEVMGSSASSSYAQDNKEESVHQSCISCGISTGGGNNLPQTTPNHQTSMNCTSHAKSQASKLKCLHILLSVLILEQGDQKNCNLLVPWGLLKKAMRDKTLYFFCSFLQY